MLAYPTMPQESSSAAPEPQSYVRQAAPKLPFFDWEACPFEGCTYREWTSSSTSLHPSVHGWQQPHGAVLDEQHDGRWRSPWTVISLSERKIYMGSLEKASVGEDIGRFADLLATSSRRQAAARRAKVSHQ